MPSMYVMAESEGIMRGWDWEPQGRVTMTDAKIQTHLRGLFLARSRRDYETSDALRDELRRAGVRVEIERDRIRGKW